jgi:hypothetical protein
MKSKLVDRKGVVPVTAKRKYARLTLSSFGKKITTAFIYTMNGA